MPIFEYKCTCGHLFEVLQLPGKEVNLSGCPKCGGQELSKVISKPFLPSSVGAPADSKSMGTCCGSKPENEGCTPGACCGGGDPKSSPAH